MIRAVALQRPSPSDRHHSGSARTEPLCSPQYCRARSCPSPKAALAHLPANANSTPKLSTIRRRRIAPRRSGPQIPFPAGTDLAQRRRQHELHHGLPSGKRIHQRPLTLHPADATTREISEPMIPSACSTIAANAAFGGHRDDCARRASSACVPLAGPSWPPMAITPIAHLAAPDRQRRRTGVL